MPNPMAMAAGALGHSLKLMAGRSVTYRRGNGGPVPITAVVIEPNIQIIAAADGANTQIERRDWMVTRSEMTLTPQPGDEIFETINGVTTVWETSEIGDKKCFEDFGDPGTLWRVRTHKASEES